MSTSAPNFFFTSSPKKYQRLRWPAQSFSFASFSLQARMRGVRSFTLVPPLSVSTSSDLGTGLPEAAYFGFAIFRTMSITGTPPGLTRLALISGALCRKFMSVLSVGMGLRPAKAHEKLPGSLHRHPRAPPGLTRLAWISGPFCRKFAASPVCPRVRSPLPAVVFRPCPSLPLSTLRTAPHDAPRKTRGQDGFAAPFLSDSFIPDCMPVYPGAPPVPHSH